MYSAQTDAVRKAGKLFSAISHAWNLQVMNPAALRTLQLSKDHETSMLRLEVAPQKDLSWLCPSTDIGDPSGFRPIWEKRLTSPTYIYIYHFSVVFLHMELQALQWPASKVLYSPLSASSLGGAAACAFGAGGSERFFGLAFAWTFGKWTFTAFTWFVNLRQFSWINLAMSAKADLCPGFLLVWTCSLSQIVL